MIDTYLRAPYQRLFLDPIVQFKWIGRLNPTSISIMGGLFGFASALLIPIYPLLAIALLLFSGFCDTLDGTLARACKKTSSKGALIDIFIDRCVEFSILLALFPRASLVTFCALGAILLCITSFLTVGIFEQNQTTKSFHYSPGLIERTEAFAFFIAMIALPSLYIPLTLLFTLLTLATALLRITQFIKFKEQK